MPNEKPTFNVGADILCPPFRTAGRVLEGPNASDQYLIMIGAVKLWIAADRLKPAASDSKKKRGKKARARHDSGDAADLRIDLHGLNVEQALREVEGTIDQALLKGSSRIEIIHGLGSGTLRRAVDKYLSTSKHISSFKIDERNPGTTWVYI